MLQEPLDEVVLVSGARLSTDSRAIYRSDRSESYPGPGGGWLAPHTHAKLFAAKGSLQSTG